MRAVNLLPQDSSRGRLAGSKNLPAVVGAALGVIVVASLAGGYLMQSAKVADARRGLDAAKAQLAKTPLPPPPPKQPVAPTAVMSQEQPRLQAVADALSQRIAWDRILREFSLVLPNDVWLSSLQLTVPAAGGEGLSIAGSTYSYDSVARLLSRLSLIPDLTQVTLGTTTTSGKLVTFDAKAAVKGAPAPAVPPAPATATSTTTTTGATS